MARSNKSSVRKGRDPFTAEAKALAVVVEERKANGIPTVYDAAAQVYENKKDSWKSDKYRAAWWQGFMLHVFPVIGDANVSDVRRGDLVEVLAPLARTSPDTKKKIKYILKGIFEWAQAYEYRADNPVDAIEVLLPQVSRDSDGFAFLDYADVPESLNNIRHADALTVTKLALTFTVLTATRGGEVRGMMWNEVDGDVWTIPASRMKGNRAHRIPLSEQAQHILTEAKRRFRSDGLVFAKPNGKQLSENAFSTLARREALGCHPHGYRKSFRNWCGDQEDIDRVAAELCLAHDTKGSVEGIYWRSDLLPQRAEIMQVWADHCDPLPF